MYRCDPLPCPVKECRRTPLLDGTGRWITIGCVNESSDHPHTIRLSAASSERAIAEWNRIASAMKGAPL